MSTRTAADTGFDAQHETELRLTHCEVCGGDGGFSEPVSMDPFSGRIREQVYTCEVCGGTGEYEIELQEIEMEDLEEIHGA